MTTSSKTKLFSGVYTALITPFTSSGALDLVQYERLIDQQIASGVDGIVPCGTTGESPTLSKEEKKKLITTAVKKAAGKIKVLAGTGSNCTQTTIEDTKTAQDLGVDGVLIVTPYYNKPSQRGLFAHFEKISKETNAKIVLYNVPGRTSVSISSALLFDLLEIKNIVGIKEATGNLGLFTEMRLAVRNKNRLEDFSILSGDDPTLYPFFLAGGDGVISVLSNVAPKITVKLWMLSKNTSQKDSAEKISEILNPISNNLFIESNPVPVKWLMNQVHGYSAQLRLPLIELSVQNQKILWNIWESLPEDYKG